MKSFAVGIDEVGRGALAGPVVVASVALPKGVKCQVSSVRCGKLRDSKKLTPRQREAWFEYFKAHPKVGYAIACVYPRQIEKRNISRAANLAAERAYKRLIANRPASTSRGETGKLQIVKNKSKNDTRYAIGDRHAVYLDGGLYIGNKRGLTRTSRGLTQTTLSNGVVATTIVRGDEKIKAIAAASIIAKVSRDRLMVRLAKKYPQYGFEIHKGYGTKKHLVAIKRYGVSKVHRATFC